MPVSGGDRCPSSTAWLLMQALVGGGDLNMGPAFAPTIPPTRGNHRPPLPVSIGKMGPPVGLKKFPTLDPHHEVDKRESTNRFGHERWPVHHR